MPKTVDDFREDLPEFKDPLAYPKEAVQFWLDAAYLDLNAARFGNVLDRAAEMFAAHFLVLGRTAVITSSFGKVPGQATGVIASKGVDKANVSYDSSMVSEKGAGFWNLTAYGLRFWWLLKTRCLGPVYRSPGPRQFTAW